jgi:hypothetical protein
MSSKSEPADGAKTIVPSDTATLGYETKGIYVGGAGDVKGKSLDGNDVTFTAPVGVVIPIVTEVVYSTGTTATKLIGLY